MSSKNIMDLNWGPDVDFHNCRSNLLEVRLGNTIIVKSKTEKVNIGSCEFLHNLKKEQIY